MENLIFVHVLAGIVRGAETQSSATCSTTERFRVILGSTTKIGLGLNNTDDKRAFRLEITEAHADSHWHDYYKCNQTRQHQLRSGIVNSARRVQSR